MHFGLSTDGQGNFHAQDLMYIQYALSWLYTNWVYVKAVTDLPINYSYSGIVTHEPPFSPQCFPFLEM